MERHIIVVTTTLKRLYADAAGDTWLEAAIRTRNPEADFERVNRALHTAVVVDHFAYTQMQCGISNLH